MDIRGRIIELLRIDGSSIDCDPGFFDDMHYRRLYVQTTKERESRSFEHRRLASAFRKRLSAPPVCLSSPRILNRSTTSDGLILTAEEACQLEVLLRDYEALLAHENKTKEIVGDVLVTWELGRNAYRKGERSVAAQLMQWTSGKRGKVNLEREICFSYIRLTTGDKGQPKIKGSDAVKILKKKYNVYSEDAVIQVLKRVRAMYKRIGVPLPAFRIPNWTSTY